MLPPPKMISPETFPECWDYIARKHAITRKSRLISSFVDPICHFVFLVEALFLTLGLAYTHVPVAGLSTLILKIPNFTALWFAFSRNVLHRFPLPDALPALAWEIIIGLVIAWMVSLVTGLLVNALLRLVYHPRRASLPSCETEGEMARQLLTLVRKTQYHHRKIGTNAALICGAIYLLLTSAVALLTFFSMPQEQQNTILSSLGSLFIMAFPAIYFVYAGLDYPVYLLAGLMYRCPAPKEFNAQTREYVSRTLPKKEADRLLSIPVHNFGGLRRLWFLLTIRLQNLPIVLKYRQMPMGFPCPLTNENLADAWKWANKKQYWAKKKLVVHKITSLFVQPYFALMLFAMVFGGLLDSATPVLRSFFHQWPAIISVWEKVQPILYQGTISGQLTGRRLLLLYLLPAGFILLTAALVFLVYHPRAQAQDNQASLAPQLSQLLSDTDAVVKSRTTGMASFSHSAFAVIGALFLLVFLIFCYSDPYVKAVAQPQMAAILKNTLIALLLLLLGYRLVRVPLDLCSLLVSFCCVPPRALAEVEAFLEQQPGEGSGSEESSEKEDAPCQNPTIKS